MTAEEKFFVTGSQRLHDYVKQLEMDKQYLIDTLKIISSGNYDERQTAEIARVALIEVKAK
jgi:hypothetical protein